MARRSHAGRKPILPAILTTAAAALLSPVALMSVGVARMKGDSATGDDVIRLIGAKDPL